MCGLIAMPLVTSSRVWPSGGDFATSSVAMMVAAPARLSITTGWPNASESRGPSTRAVASTGPPAGNGTMSRIGRVG
jgi:hypothetical protein